MSARKTLVNSILALLFVMPSLAYGELALTIWGQEAPDPPSITLWAHRGTNPVGVSLLAGHTIECYDLAFVLVDLGEEPPDLEPDFIFHWDSIEFPTNFDDAGHITYSDEQLVWVAAAQIFSPPVSGPAVLVENLGVQNLEVLGLSRLDLIVVGDTIMDGEQIPVDTVLDSAIVFEIPEPATLLLLGLGMMMVIKTRGIGSFK